MTYRIPQKTISSHHERTHIIQKREERLRGYGTLEAEDSRQCPPFLTTEVAEVVVYRGDDEAQRSYQSPEDPEVIGDCDFVLSFVVIEEFSTEDRLFHLSKTQNIKTWELTYRDRG